MRSPSLVLLTLASIAGLVAVASTFSREAGSREPLVGPVRSAPPHARESDEGGWSQALLLPVGRVEAAPNASATEVEGVEQEPDRGAFTPASTPRYHVDGRRGPVGGLVGRVILRGGGEFTALVEGHREVPEIQSRIAAGEPGGPTYARAWTESDGRFRIQTLGLGRWRIAASRDGRTWSWSGTVDVRDREYTRVPDLILFETVPDPTLEGRVVDAAGTPVAGARIHYTRARSGSGTTATDPHGCFVIAGPAGEQVVIEVEAARLDASPARTTACVGDAGVELVLHERPILVVQLAVPAGFIARNVTLRLLGEDDQVLLTHEAQAGVEHIGWPEGAAWLHVPADYRFAATRVALPARPPRGEARVFVEVRAAYH